jgi:hypothetical protein
MSVAACLLSLDLGVLCGFLGLLDSETYSAHRAGSAVLATAVVSLGFFVGFLEVPITLLVVPSSSARQAFACLTIFALLQVGLGGFLVGLEVSPFLDCF